MPIVLTQNEVTESGHSYADVLGEAYEYPRRYQKLINTGERFVYYRGRRRASGGVQPQAYLGTGLIGDITDVGGGLLQCRIRDYRPFARPVPFKPGGEYYETGAKSYGSRAGLYFRQGARRIDQEVYAKIVADGARIRTTGD